MEVDKLSFNEGLAAKLQNLTQQGSKIIAALIHGNHVFDVQTLKPPKTVFDLTNGFKSTLRDLEVYDSDGDRCLGPEDCKQDIYYIRGLPTETGPAFQAQWRGNASEGILGKINAKLPYSLREETSLSILKKAVSEGVVLIAAPPYSGKTSLLQCIMNMALKYQVSSDNPQECHFKDISYTKCSLNTSFAKSYEAYNSRPFLQDSRLTPERESSEPSSKPTRIVFGDEIQCIYKEEQEFWDLVKDVSIGSRGDYRVVFILAAAYSGNKSFDIPLTPPHISDVMRILPDVSGRVIEDATPLNADIEIEEASSSGRISLNYLKSQYDAYLSKTFQYWNVPITHEIEDICTQIWNLTEGLPGTVEQILSHVSRTFLQNMENQPERVARNIDAFLNSKRVLAVLSQSPSFPSEDIFLSQASGHRQASLEVMMELIHRNGKIRQTQLDALSADARGVASILQRHGYLIAQEDLLCLPSILHLEVMRYMLLGRQYDSLQAMPQRLVDFMPIVLQKLDPQVLRETVSKGLNGKKLEAVYVAEMYRSIMSLVPDQCLVSPEYGLFDNAKGRTDLILTPQRWVFEALREHDRIAAHQKRFSPPCGATPAGRYYTLIQQRKIKNGLSLIAMSTPQPISEMRLRM